MTKILLFLVNLLVILSGFVSADWVRPLSQSSIINNYYTNLTNISYQYNASGWVYYDSSIITNGSPSVSIGSGVSLPNQDNPVGKVTIRGDGITNATASIIVTNSNNQSLFYVRDDGAVGFGQLSLAALKSNTLTANYNVTANRYGFYNQGTALGLFSTSNNLSVRGSIFQVYTNFNTLALTVDSAQEVGIGTNNPTEKLHIYGAGSRIKFQAPLTSQSTGAVFSDTADRMVMYKPANSSDLRINSQNGGIGDMFVFDYDAGYVGIRTNNPSAYLEVNGTGFIRQNVYYNVSSITNITANQGTIASLSNCLDNDWYNISEGGGTPGFENNFTFTGVSSFRNIVFCGLYQGSSTHHIEVYVYNYNLSLFIPIREINTGNVMNCNYFGLDGIPEHIINNTNVKLRVYHPDSGNPSHVMNINCLRLER